MQKTTLRQELATLKDNRRKQGQRHAIDVALMVVIMATMSGFIGYRPMGDFVTRYKEELLEYLQPLKKRLPSLATIRRLLLDMDTVAFAKIVERWCKHNTTETREEEWVSVDGKAIRGTIQKDEDKKLAHMVSFFRSDSKEILMQRQTAAKSNEIPLVQEMLKDLGIENLILTLDAMHCQSETLKAIKDSGNEYVVGVKKNQKKF